VTGSCATTSWAHTLASEYGETGATKPESNDTTSPRYRTTATGLSDENQPEKEWTDTDLNRGPPDYYELE